MPTDARAFVAVLSAPLMAQSPLESSPLPFLGTEYRVAAALGDVCGRPCPAIEGSRDC